LGLTISKENPDARVKKETGSWCAVDIKNAVIRAQIVHIGRGKFKIVGDNQDGTYVGQVVDASDVINCER
jgi:hypothetical protein